LIFILLAGMFAPSPARAEGPAHIVAPGETLSSIAARYHTTVEALVELNALADPDVIVVGQRLVLPATSSPTASPPTTSKTSAVIHVVSAGETLSMIARRYGVPLSDVIRWNGLADPNRLEVGQKIRIALPPVEMDTPLPAGPVERVDVAPLPIQQGDTFAVMVTLSEPASLRASFAGRETPFVEEGTRAWALFGVHPMQEPGYYPLVIRAQPLEPDTAAKAAITLQVLVAAGAFPTYNLVFAPGSEQSALLDPAIVRREAARVGEVFAGRTLPRRWAGLFRIPLPAGTWEISSPFGERRSYNGGPATSYHEGLDLSVLLGTPVYAPANGRVVLAEALDVRGNAVILDHGLGVFSGFWHLSEILVSEGEDVRAGTLIGRVGSTGLSTGPHLHWELRVGGIAVDPMQWATETFPFIPADEQSILPPRHFPERYRD